MRKVAVDRKGERDFFTSAQIKECMKKVVPVNLHQTLMVDDELEIKAYYAGHVLGAAMFSVRVGQQSVVYTVSGCRMELLNGVKCKPGFNCHHEI